MYTAQSYRTSHDIWDQCYLPPNTGERALPNLSQKGWYSIYLPGGIEGWVDLSGWLLNEMVCPPLDVEKLCWSRPMRYHKARPPKLLLMFMKVLWAPALDVWPLLWHCLQEIDTCAVIAEFATGMPFSSGICFWPKLSVFAWNCKEDFVTTLQFLCR